MSKGLYSPSKREEAETQRLRRAGPDSLPPADGGIPSAGGKEVLHRRCYTRGGSTGKDFRREGGDLAGIKM